MASTDIVTCRIHPGIGVARIGNSPDEFFFGPEVPNAHDDPPGGYKDAAGRIKRQVARFRIYGYNAAGEVVREITAAEAEIIWSVRVANKKAAWYVFDRPLDIPGAQPTPRRNPTYPGDRNNLVIDAGVHEISGANAREPLTGGSFLGVEVPLGELRTDNAGRLLFFGGQGQSGSISNQPVSGFDPGQWYDDVSDGPVTASVQIDGMAVPVTPAWVITGPPSYAPGLHTIVTLYDVVYEVFVEAGWLSLPSQPSFTQNIYPIFKRLNHLQWVNEAFYLYFGWGAPEDLLSDAMLAKLSNNSPTERQFRTDLFKRFRNPDFAHLQPEAIPPFYGDGATWPPEKDNPRAWLALPRLNYMWLQNWANGNFIADWDPSRKRPSTDVNDLPLAEQPAALDRAALEQCLGGAFHPGCEITWPMRHQLLYYAPFRIKPRSLFGPERDYGAMLTPAAALNDDGPINGSNPGDLTRWMSVPWQVDTASCGAGYSPEINPYLPTFWPVRSPNQVLLEKHYLRALETDLSTAQRLKYFSLRQDWLRDFSILLTHEQRLHQFLKDWFKVGFIVRRDMTQPYSELPPEVYIEVDNELEAKPDERYEQIDPRKHR
jgi:hypothetical protein